MRKVIMIMILVLFSCKSVKEAAETNKKDILLQYSKSSCLGGGCPVYDLYIYKDGMLLYKSTKGLKSEKERNDQLSSAEITDLTTFLQANLEEPVPFKKVRDVQVTTLKYDSKKYQYHASRIEGKLKTVDSRIEALVSQLLTR